MAYAWCRDPMLADDLVQECLVKALRNRASLEDPARLNAWLFRILSNCWRDHLRRRRETEPLDDHHGVQEHTPEDAHSADQLVEQVRAAVAALSEGHRQVLTLVDLEGFSYAEVADMAGIPVGTVMSRLSRARTALRAALADLHGGQEQARTRLVRVK
jgi:RNA polymerase sigma-70 factor (ECF subfamily)